MSGPISVAASSGIPTRRPLAVAAYRSSSSSLADSSTISRERAQQSWPQFSNTAYGAILPTFSRSASAKTTHADFPPSSSVTRLIVAAACRAMPAPTSVEPVNPILPTSGCSTSAAPTVAARPGDDVQRARRGCPASTASSA